MRDVLRLKAPAFKAFVTDRGWVKSTGDPNYAVAAMKLGVHPATVTRLVSGKTSPSADFIAALMELAPGRDFSDFFEREQSTAGVVA